MFQDRMEAGQRLASQLLQFAKRPDVLVLALPRGGVPVGYELARALHLPLDIFAVRKLGVPWEPELAMGAIASGGTRVLNTDLVNSLGISEAELDRVSQREKRELEAHEHLYRGDRPPFAVAGRTVILVDDGLATGSTMRAAASALRLQKPARIIIAVPVAAVQTCQRLRDEGYEVVCAETPEPFFAVGQWYRDFSATSDAEVQDLLQRNAAEVSSPGRP